MTPLPFRQRVFPLTALILFPLLLLGAGCSARKAPQTRSSAGELILLGRENLKDRNFERAREAFNRILLEYPESNVRSEALLSLAESFYADKDYQEAKFQYEKFIQLYPVNPQTPRALYFLAMSDYQELNSVDRDQTQTRGALKNFRRLVRQFPQNAMVSEVRPKIRDLETRLAAKQLYIGRFHYSSSNYQSAIPRFLRLLKEFPKAPAADDALYYLADSYAREENYSKAGQALNRLIRDFPKSPYRRKAERLLRGLPKRAKAGSNSR